LKKYAKILTNVLIKRRVLHMSSHFAELQQTDFLYASVGCEAILSRPKGRAAIQGVFMKNTIKFLGIIALAAIIGFSFTACGDGDDDGGGGGGKISKALQGTWKNDDLTDYYLVFTKDSFGTGNSVAESTQESGKNSFIAKSDNGSKIEFEHKDFGKNVTGSITYSVTGSKLTVSATTGGGTFQTLEGTWTKQ
jgi:hypothetical protein